MYQEEQFVNDFLHLAEKSGNKIERHRDRDIRQIDFGHKKLHEDHVRALFPAILLADEDLGRVIESVAPGRPCTHRPVRIIMAEILRDRADRLLARSHPLAGVS